MSIIERIESAMRERRIMAHAREAIACSKAKDGIGARIAFARMSNEIKARTPEQVARMERARRLEARQHG